MEMGIASLSMSMSSSKLASDVSMSVLNLAMDNMDTESSSMLNVIESADPNLGNSIDAFA